MLGLVVIAFLGLVVLGAVAGLVMLLVFRRTAHYRSGGVGGVAGAYRPRFPGVILWWGHSTAYHSETIQSHEITRIAPVPPPAKSPGHASGSSITTGSAPSLAVSSKPASKKVPAPARPAWVDALPGRHGDVYRLTATIGPYSTRIECDAKTPEVLQTALADYTEIYLGPAAARQIDLPGDQLAGWLIKDQMKKRSTPWSDR